MECCSSPGSVSLPGSFLLVLTVVGSTGSMVRVGVSMSAVTMVGVIMSGQVGRSWRS